MVYDWYLFNGILILLNLCIAFDMVKHTILLYSMEQYYGRSGTVLN